MRPIIPTTETAHPVAQVINLQEEEKLEKEAQALVELHDFIKAHPDSPVKEIARFMPPVDARVVNKAIQKLAIRDQHITPEEKAARKSAEDSIEAKHQAFKWGK